MPVIYCKGWCFRVSNEASLDPSLYLVGKPYIVIKEWVEPLRNQGDVVEGRREKIKRQRKKRGEEGERRKEKGERRRREVTTSRDAVSRGSRDKTNIVCMPRIAGRHVFIYLIYYIIYIMLYIMLYITFYIVRYY